MQFNNGGLTQVFEGAPTPIFALLIGINEYKSHNYKPMKLYGCVNDVRHFKAYLEDYLGTPSEHITLICDEEATRDVIIRSFKNLAEDDRIQHNDAIIIYFSGHGAEITAPDGWECSDPRRQIQSILPQDISDWVPPIPDRTINQLIASISMKHGQNITVILDCCYSGSGTRSGDDSLRYRSVDLELDSIPEDLDTDILPVPPSEFMHHSLQSHHLLAACGSREKAAERRVTDEFGNYSHHAGCFSLALLKLLLRVPPNQITYSKVLKSMDPVTDGQNPQYEGFNKNRLLFSTEVMPPPPNMSFYVFYKPGEDGRQGSYTIHAGRFHHVTKDTQFTLYYEDDLSLSTPLVVLRVVKLDEFQVIALPVASNGREPFVIPPDSPRQAMAIPNALTYKDSETVQIWLDPASKNLHDLYQTIVRAQADKMQRVRLTTSEGLAEVKFRLDEREGILVETFPCAQVIPRPTPLKWRGSSGLTPNFETFSSVLERASSFYAELKRPRPRPDTASSLLQAINIEFFELEICDIDDEDFGFLSIYQPKNDINLFRDNAIRITIPDSGDKYPFYGLKLTNTTPAELYVNMHIFSNSSLSVKHFFDTTVDTTYTLDSSLPALNRSARGNTPGTLAIGYGSTQRKPFFFKLDEDVSHDIDYLVIYFSTLPLDTTFLNQDSIFESADDRAARPRPKGMTVAAWDYIVIPIIQQRAGHSA